MASCQSACTIVTKSASHLTNQFVVNLYNTIGMVLKSSIIEIKPSLLALNSKIIICVGHEKSAVWIWWYGDYPTSVKDAAVTSALEGNSAIFSVTLMNVHLKGRQRGEVWFHIDDVHSIFDASTSTNTIPANNTVLAVDLRRRPYVMSLRLSLSYFSPSVDPVQCVATSESTLLFGRKSGLILQLNARTLEIEMEYRQLCGLGELIYPISLFINCNDTTCAIIDSTGSARLLQLAMLIASVEKGDAPKPSTSHESTSVSGGGQLLEFERKDVCDIRWAVDDANLFSAIEKSRLYVFRNLEVEEPISFSGYLCDFSDLNLLVLAYDELMNSVSSWKSRATTQAVIQSNRDAGKPEDENASLPPGTPTILLPETLQGYLSIIETKRMRDTKSFPPFFNCLKKSSRMLVWPMHFSSFKTRRIQVCGFWWAKLHWKNPI